MNTVEKDKDYALIIEEIPDWSKGEFVRELEN